MKLEVLYKVCRVMNSFALLGITGISAGRLVAAGKRTL